MGKTNTKRANKEYTCDGCIAKISKGAQYARVTVRYGSPRQDTLEIRGGSQAIAMHGVDVDLYLCTACAESPPVLDAATALNAREARKHEGMHVSVQDDQSRWTEGRALPMPWCGKKGVDWDGVVSDNGKPARAIKFNVCKGCKAAIERSLKTSSK